MTIEEQINHFVNGFPWLDIVAPATPGNGICTLSDMEADEAVLYFEKAEVKGLCKFVPASGAASRMFKDLFNGLDKVKNGGSIENTPASRFVEEISRFAFYDESLFKGMDARTVLARTLNYEGLGYGSKPKGVIAFHRYPNGEIRTAFEEHLVEAQEYMRNPDGTAVLTVTISPEHESLFKEVFEAKRAEYEKRYRVKYEVRFTYQDKSTDTIAVDMENRPFLNDDGSRLFRPAGHGALIYNLNEIEEELVSIKNIDNVACERLLPLTARYKRVLMGKALEMRDTIFAFLRCADSWNEAECGRIESFLQNTLSIRMPSADLNLDERRDWIFKILDRPIRVCGMVRNEGEPGGGPFIIREKDGSTSLQILEKAQINEGDPQAHAALASSTHFNPVDIVCCLRRFDGTKFNLPDYVDPQTGFISYKSSQGRDLKALELPGLWNGAMSRWNTMFVEVPLETFNPVKTVLDLLKPSHQ